MWPRLKRKEVHNKEERTTEALQKEIKEYVDSALPDLKNLRGPEDTFQWVSENRSGLEKKMLMIIRNPFESVDMDLAFLLSIPPNRRPVHRGRNVEWI